MLNDKISFGWAAVASGITITLLVTFGFRAISWTAKISVPLFLIVVSYIFMILFFFKNSISSDRLGEATMSINQAATMVAGTFMVGALITPDLSRYCQSKKHVFWMITTSVIIGEFIINGISILVAQSLNTSDVVTIMTHSAGWIGLLSVTLSAIKANDVNLYSSSLDFANTLEMLIRKKVNYSKLTIYLGLTGTTLSALGILNHFVDFLVTLGVIFPPIAGVMLIDYYILRTHRELLNFTRSHGTLPDEASTKKIGWSAMVAWIVGSIVGFTINWGIPSLNSLLTASVFYWITCIIVNKYFVK